MKVGLSGPLQSLLICLCFRGVNGFVGHSPSRSAEVVAVKGLVLKTHSECNAAQIEQCNSCAA